jgi:hypothetical protein
MAISTITNTVPTLTQEQATQHLEVYRLAVSSLKGYISSYLRLNNRKYGGRNKTTKASLLENLSYYRGQLHAYEAILHMVDEKVKAPMVSMSHFYYDKDINHWSLMEGVLENIEHRHFNYVESILENVK